MLEIRDVDCFYGEAQVLKSFSLRAEAGEILWLLGRNGAGKTTALKAVMGLVKARRGSNFVSTFALRTEDDKAKWVARGVALLWSID